MIFFSPICLDAICDHKLVDKCVEIFKEDVERSDDVIDISEDKNNDADYYINMQECITHLSLWINDIIKYIT